LFDNINVNTLSYYYMPLPEWLKTNPYKGSHLVKKLLRDHGLSTVCEEARCPNQGRCFSKKTATLMILGDICTRSCNFCGVESGVPCHLDSNEPARVAQAAKALGLKYVVVTSVTRDDLSDGGAAHFAHTIRAIRKAIEKVRIEVLVPDFQANAEAIRVVIEARPEVFNHNVETVPRLYASVRPQAQYTRSLEVLKKAKEFNSKQITKSGIMIGLGEQFDEVIDVMRDLIAVGCDIFTIGQYLQPRKHKRDVTEYVKPEVFDEYKALAFKMGFRSVASSPLVRSSMDAEEVSHV
jgi:lipoic acid synthetase